MDRRLRIGAFLLMLGVSLYWAGLQGKYWSRQELSPFPVYLLEVEKTVPREARVLIVAPEADRTSSYTLQLNGRLAPRLCYFLPPGAKGPEEAAEWIREKSLTWAVSLGGPDYDART